MRGQHAAVAVQQRQRGVTHLTIVSAPGHLQMGLDQMRHGAADAAMAIAQEPAMGVERHLAAAAEITGADARRSLAATGETEVFQQHRERNGEAVIDRRVADV